MKLDSIELEIIKAALEEAALTMENQLFHSGYSPILRESKDGTAGLTDAQGRVVMLSGGLQYHCTAYEQGVKALLERFPNLKFVPYQTFGNVDDPNRESEVLAALPDRLKEQGVDAVITGNGG